MRYINLRFNYLLTYCGKTAEWIRIPFGWWMGSSRMGV